MSSPDDILAVALKVARCLEELHIPHQLVGSVASSLHGQPRMRQDIDFVVRMRPGGAPLLAEALGHDIDFFALLDTPYASTSFQRRRAEIVTPEEERLLVQTPEDVVLQKLAWYRDGGEVSSQQWNDVVHVLRVQASTLDTR